MCMKELNQTLMPKKIFLKNLQRFELSQFLSNAHNSAYFVKSTALRAFTVSFKCMVGMLRHIENVHEEV